MVSGEYRPLRAAYACAAASMARQSLPVAIATASMPFMMPLLCVVARYGSIAANSFARMMPSRTCSPEKSPGRAASIGITARRAHEARSVRFDRMRRNTCPPVISSISGATASHIVLTRFAPIASQLSTTQVHHDQFAVLGGVAAQEHLDVLGAAAAQHHVRMLAVRDIQDLLRAQQQLRARPLRVGHVEHLHLPEDHRGRRRRW